jgi:Tol biopolymer transport system component/DNA-binding winged helix-turn-helix (wHTH) protein
MSGSTFEFGTFTLDPAEHRLCRDGRPVPVTPRVFDLLLVLVSNAGHLVEKERLLKEVWRDAFVEEGNLNRAVSVLRKTLGETPAERFIETVPKRGYRFVAAVRTIPFVSTERGDDGNVSGGISATGRQSMTGVAVMTGLTLVVVIAILVTLRMAGDSASFASTRPTHRQLTFTGHASTPSLSPDGMRIAYVSKQSPLQEIVVQDTTGARAVIFRAPEAGALRWSPDGTGIAFSARADGQIGQYVVPATGGAARKIATGSFVACWSPDGSEIALAHFNPGRVVRVNKRGEVQHQFGLDGTRDWIWSLDWSQDHGLLVVADDDQRRPTIWTVQANGEEQRKVFTGSTEILGARWAPDHEGVYYLSRVDQTVSLYKIPFLHGAMAGNSEPTVLLDGIETDEGFGISADGSRLVYARAPYYSNLWIVDSTQTWDGNRAPPTQLTQGTAVVERPRVSPDGRTIVFSRGDETRAELYTIATSGGSPRQLTFLNAFSVDGAWSPDGRAVAFASTAGGRRRVWMVNVDGSAPRALSEGEMSEAFDVTWAPGARILYQQDGNRNFYVVDPESSHERLLIDDASVGWPASAEYSPDGKTIAVGWNRSPVAGIWLIDANGSDDRLVHGTSRQLPDLWPIGWSTDGRFIMAVTGKRAAYRGLTASFEETLTEAKIVRVPSTGGAAESVMVLPFAEVGSMAVFPDGRRFVVAVYSSRSDVWSVDGFDRAAPHRQRH